MQRRLIRWFFTDRSTGQIIVAQWPNLALWIFLAALCVGTFVRRGLASSVVQGVATLSLAVWACDEILRGVNPWRRLLGTAVPVWVCYRILLAFAS